MLNKNTSIVFYKKEIKYMNKVEVFSSDTCKQCIDLKKYLKEIGFKFTKNNLKTQKIKKIVTNLH